VSLKGLLKKKGCNKSNRKYHDIHGIYLQAITKGISNEWEYRDYTSK